MEFIDHYIKFDRLLNVNTRIFEYIVETGRHATHRVFIPNGKINGIPN